MKSGRSVLWPLLVAVVVVAAACSPANTTEAPPPSVSTPPVVTGSSDPTIEAGDQLEERLNKIAGVQAVATSPDDDVDCMPSGNHSVIDIPFSARNSTAMRAALISGRDALNDLISDAVICLTGTYDATGNKIRILATDSYLQTDGLWPTNSMINDLVRAARIDPGRGSHLVWSARTDTDADLTVSNDLDQSPSPTEAVRIFQLLENRWDPPSDYHSVSIFVSADSAGYLSTTQQARYGRWHPIPDQLIKAFLATQRRTEPPMSPATSWTRVSSTISSTSSTPMSTTSAGQPGNRSPTQ